MQLKFSTMTAADTITASLRIRGLQAKGLQFASSITLQQVYTRDFFPVDKSYIPTKNTAVQWNHFRPLTNQLPPLLNCKVVLLIGFDRPSGGENEPFTQRTDLDWSIIGLSIPHLD